MASKVTPSIPGAPSFLLAISYAARKVSILQTWTYSPQNRQDGSAFALTYILRLRSCKSMDVFVISSLPSPTLETSQMAGPLCSANITPLHRYYGPSRHPLVFGRLPGFAAYTPYLSPAEHASLHWTHDRACRSPASGSPTGFTARYTESKRTARGFGTVSNSPSPLDTAISGGACH